MCSSERVPLSVSYTPEMAKALSRWEGLLRMYNPEGSTYDLRPPFWTVVLRGAPQHQDQWGSSTDWTRGVLIFH